MEETECIVCFSEYDEKEHRPRSLACGHTLCTECVEKGIREVNKACPKCRKAYSASNVNDVPINFTLEGVMKLLKIFKSAKGSDVPECAEHQLPVSNRCTMHKCWVCQSCLNEDHPLATCKIITVSEELNAKKTTQIDKAKPLLNKLEETCKNLEDCNKLCEKQMEENTEEIERNENIVKNLQEEIQKKKTANIQMVKDHTISKEKLEILKGKISSYDQAMTSLKCSETIKGVSKCSIEVQKEATMLHSISRETEKEVDQMMQDAKVAFVSRFGLSLKNHKLSVRNGKHHLHVLQGYATTLSPPCNSKFSDEVAPPQTDGILTFMDFSFPRRHESQRVYIKIFANTARARQHLIMMTGERGLSYVGLEFASHFKKGKPGEHLHIAPYGFSNAMPLLKNVTVNDNNKRKVTAGLVTGAKYQGDFNNATFAVWLGNWPRYYDNNSFALVTSGLEVLQEIAKSDQREKIVVVDCGVVLF